MTKLKINQTTAIKLYPESPDWFKSQLNEKFGEDTFKPRDWHSIKTFEDACEVMKIDSKTLVSETDTPDEAAYKKLKIIVAAINQGWVLDWSNSDQYKYYPWFNLSSGSGFSDLDDVYDCSGSTVGSRLCYQSKEKCLYAAEQFKAIYEDFFIIK